MRTVKSRAIAFLVSAALILCGCNSAETTLSPDTPQEAVEYTLESIRTLDMTTLNNCTDNFVQTYHNWIGIPIESEYRAFNELLQPQSKNSSRYKTAYRLDQKMTERLTWEITEVREDSSSNTAEIDLMITNINMQKVMERYEIQLIEAMLSDPGTGITQMIRDTVNAKDILISLIEELDDSDIVTTPVTASAYRENGQWKIHMSRDFINAFSGNMFADNDSEEIIRLEEQLDDMANEWADAFEERMDKWAERFEKNFDRWMGEP
ncbi:MAG: hypothetical protein HFH76_11065 [Lachnospiraceae bacterium]|jgi:hypothetical protein|nr:hypothetical protein [Lachnospiraceae bacterium]